MKPCEHLDISIRAGMDETRKTGKARAMGDRATAYRMATKLNWNIVKKCIRLLGTCCSLKCKGGYSAGSVNMSLRRSNSSLPGRPEMPMTRNKPSQITAVGTLFNSPMIGKQIRIRTFTNNGEIRFSQTPTIVTFSWPPSLVISLVANAFVNCGECGKDP